MGVHMLDKRTSALLQSINDFCSSGTYKIFSEEDFLSAFPEKWGVTAEALAQMLDYLSENGYINVLYLSSSPRPRLLRTGGGKTQRMCPATQILHVCGVFRILRGFGARRFDFRRHLSRHAMSGAGVRRKA